MKIFFLKSTHCLIKQNFLNHKTNICFYDFIKRNNIKKINNISVKVFIFDSLMIVAKYLLLIIENDKISFINVNLYNVIKTIKIDNSGLIYAAFM